MKKIALCFYGQPRLVKKGYETISKFLNTYCLDYDIDVFVHTWWCPSLIGKKYNTSPWRNISENELTIYPDTIDVINTLYKPKLLMYEAPKIFEEEIESIKYTDLYSNSNETIKHNINNTISNIYSKYKVSQILKEYIQEKSIEYSHVISLRFDLHNEINFDINNSEPNKIYTGLFSNTRFYLTDHFIIFSNIQLFFNYSSVFKNIYDINISNECKDMSREYKLDFKINPEELITLNLRLYYNLTEINKLVVFTDKIPGFN